MTDPRGPSAPTPPMASTTQSSQPLTREELWARIRTSSKDAVILDEMIRLGFWPPAGTLPADPADDIRRQTEIQAELAALRSEHARLQNVDAMRKELRRRRFEEARKRRRETRERREADRKERARRYQEQLRTDAPWLGVGVSGGLGHKVSDAARLAELGLPVLQDAMELATFLGVSVGELRFLTFHREVARTHHYRRWALPKKTGGLREISAPMPRLKSLQRKVLDDVLARLPVHEAAHGFVAGRNIVSGASPHVGQGVVVNLDLQDFFPTVTLPRVKGLFRSFGYSEQVATLLALLCTEAPVREVVLDGRTWFVVQGDRRLPQGAPTSPALTNLLCRHLDRQLDKTARDLGFTYTRYADDLSFSHDDPKLPPHRVRQLLGRCRFLVEKAGFAVHPKKTRVMRPGDRKEVTGVLVHDRPRVAREKLRRFRAALHHLEKHGLAGAHFGDARADEGQDVVAALDGFASFVLMVDEEKGRALKAELARVTATRGLTRKPTPRTGRPGGPSYRRFEAADELAEAQAAPSGPAPSGSPPPRVRPVAADGTSAEPEKPKKPWWKFW